MLKMASSFCVISPLVRMHTVTVQLPERALYLLYQYALKMIQKTCVVKGFLQGRVPLQYLERNYKIFLVQHVSQIFFNFYISDEIFRYAYLKGITLEKVIKQHNLLEGSDNFCQTAKYDLLQAVVEPSGNWKTHRCKFPPRKKYKDLDKQAENLVAQEIANKKNSFEQIVSNHDWIQFTVQLYDIDTNLPILDTLQTFWLYMSSEDINQSLVKFFKGKKLNDVFIVIDKFFQSFFTEHTNILYGFSIVITQCIPHAYFELDVFKKGFEINSTAELYTKLIEVFSFRNDVSQRREICQIATTVLKKFFLCNIPESLIEQQTSYIHKTILSNPDYLVYQAKKDFHEKISLLAKQQIHEYVIIDFIGAHEGIDVDFDDIKLYLNLLQRHRLRDFIYFDVPFALKNEIISPISHELVRLAARREKTINFVVKKLQENSWQK